MCQHTHFLVLVPCLVDTSYRLPHASSKLITDDRGLGVGGRVSLHFCTVPRASCIFNLFVQFSNCFWQLPQCTPLLAVNLAGIYTALGGGYWPTATVEGSTSPQTRPCPWACRHR